MLKGIHLLPCTSRLGYRKRDIRYPGSLYMTGEQRNKNTGDSAVLQSFPVTPAFPLRLLVVRAVFGTVWKKLKT